MQKNTKAIVSPNHQIEQACDIAWRHGYFQLRTLRKLIKRKKFGCRQLLGLLTAASAISGTRRLGFRFPTR